MAGLFGDIAEFFTGSKQNSAEKQQKEAMKQGKAAADQGLAATGTAITGLTDQGREAADLGGYYNRGARESMGANAADYMAKANAAAQGQAGQEAQESATQAARRALGTIRTGGVNRGAAALAAGQQAGDVYSGSLRDALNTARDRYGRATAEFAGQGAQQQQLAQNAYQGIGGLGTSQTATGINARLSGGQSLANQGAQSAQQGGGLLQGVSSYLFSDERLKELIDKGAKKNSIDDLVKKVRPVSFNYKAESGEDPSKKWEGVLAQDLEKTDMKDNVVDTPAGKMVDTKQQTMSNTNLLVQLAQRVVELEQQLKGGS
jgi:hypothetical protein